MSVLVGDFEEWKRREAEKCWDEKRKVLEQSDSYWFDVYETPERTYYLNCKVSVLDERYCREEAVSNLIKDGKVSSIVSKFKNK